MSDGDGYRVLKKIQRYAFEERESLDFFIYQSIYFYADLIDYKHVCCIHSADSERPLPSNEIKIFLPSVIIPVPSRYTLKHAGTTRDTFKCILSRKPAHRMTT